MAFTVPENVNSTSAGRQSLQALACALRPSRPAFPEKTDFDANLSDFISNLWNQLTRALVISPTVISSSAARG